MEVASRSILRGIFFVLDWLPTDTAKQINLRCYFPKEFVRKWIQQTQPEFEFDSPIPFSVPITAMLPRVRKKMHADITVAAMQSIVIFLKKSN